jgi:hypothetical protein
MGGVSCTVSREKSKVGSELGGTSFCFHSPTVGKSGDHLSKTVSS